MNKRRKMSGPKNYFDTGPQNSNKTTLQAKKSRDLDGMTRANLTHSEEEILRQNK